MEYNDWQDHTTQTVKLVTAVHDPIMNAKHVRNNFSRVSRCRHHFHGWACDRWTAILLCRCGGCHGNAWRSTYSMQQLFLSRTIVFLKLLLGGIEVVGELNKAHSGYWLYTHAHALRGRLTSSHSVSCNTFVTTLPSKCGNFNSTAYTRDMDAIKDADTPIFDESAVEGTQKRDATVKSMTI